jgi:hypothetical protein
MKNASSLEKIDLNNYNDSSFTHNVKLPNMKVNSRVNHKQFGALN